MTGYINNGISEYCNVAHLLFRNACNKQCEECTQVVKKRQAETKKLLKQ